MKPARHGTAEQYRKWAREYRERHRRDPNLKARRKRRWEKYKVEWNAKPRDKRRALKVSDPVELKAQAVAQAKGRGVHVAVPTPAVRELLKATSQCPYCLRTLHPTSKLTVVDHKQPLALGGKHELSNLIVCCLDCNTIKGAMDYADWIELVR